MSTKPTFLFVPGAWHLPAYFDPLIKYLAGHGYPSVTVTLPGVNSSPAVDSIQSDVSVVADALTALLDASTDVVAVFHSYGGMVGTDAVGKVTKERAGSDGSHGKQSGKLKRLIYVSAYVPLEGQTVMNAVDGAVAEPPPVPDYLIFEGEYIALKEHAADVFYHDVPEPLYSRYARLLGKQPTATFGTPVVHAGWRSVPSTYVYTRQDRPLPLLFQEFMAKRAHGQGGDVRAFEGEMGEVYLDSGHTPFLSMTEEIGDILIRAAESN